MWVKTFIWRIINSIKDFNLLIRLPNINADKMVFNHLFAGFVGAGWWVILFIKLFVYRGKSAFAKMFYVVLSLKLTTMLLIKPFDFLFIILG